MSRGKIQNSLPLRGRDSLMSMPQPRPLRFKSLEEVFKLARLSFLPNRLTDLNSMTRVNPNFVSFSMNDIEETSLRHQRLSHIELDRTSELQSTFGFINDIDDPRNCRNQGVDLGRSFTPDGSIHGLSI